MEGVWVALITVVLGGIAGYGGTWLKSYLDRDHNTAVVEDLVTARLQKELARMYALQDKTNTEIDALKDRLGAAERRADLADEAASVSRLNAVALLAHVVELEKLLPPPPPTRPQLQLTRDTR